ncbi:hypothetical protein GWI33_017338 [Rhynchophorus ferrugineus]|uniref:Uncharacterized protein n=1 Tax=Rhynchophorus ferrugineus TaxID=354439 RepID=A0A834HVN1_RHYFE|nr:hypothetical protein GWI33_017338 [Rhynchophorus ferrugineus]
MDVEHTRKPRRKTTFSPPTSSVNFSQFIQLSRHGVGTRPLENGKIYNEVSAENKPGSFPNKPSAPGRYGWQACTSSCDTFRMFVCLFSYVPGLRFAYIVCSMQWYIIDLAFRLYKP